MTESEKKQQKPQKAKAEKFKALSAPKGVPDYVPPTSAEFKAVKDAFTSAAHAAGYELSLIHISEPTRPAA